MHEVILTFTQFLAYFKCNEKHIKLKFFKDASFVSLIVIKNKLIVVQNCKLKIANSPKHLNPVLW